MIAARSSPRVRISAAMSSAIVSNRIGRSTAGERPCDWRSTPMTLAAGRQQLHVGAEHLHRAEAAVEQDERLPRAEAW